MNTFRILDVSAPEWSGPHLRPCHFGSGCIPPNRPADDLSRAILSSGAGWIYVQAGWFAVKSGEETFQVGPGEAVLYTNPTHASLLYPAEVTCLRVGLYGTHASKVIEFLLERFGSFHCLPQTAEVVKKTQALFAMAEKRASRPAHAWSVEMYEWFILLWKELQRLEAPREPQRRIVRNSRLMGVLHPSFKSLANEMGYHPAYLSRVLKKSWGDHSPADHLRRGRLQEAENLLRTTNLSIREIAGQVRYASPESFSTAFRRTHGISPLRYRHEYRLGWNP